MLAGPQRRNRPLAAVPAFAKHVDLTLDDDEEAVTDLALPDDDLPWLVVCVLDPVGPEHLELGQIALEQQIERPIDRDTQPPFPAGQLEQVHGSPNEPGEESRDADAEQLRHRAAP